MCQNLELQLNDFTWLDFCIGYFVFLNDTTRNSIHPRNELKILVWRKIMDCWSSDLIYFSNNCYLSLPSLPLSARFSMWNFLAVLRSARFELCENVRTQDDVSQLGPRWSHWVIKESRARVISVRYFKQSEPEDIIAVITVTTLTVMSNGTNTAGKLERVRVSKLP